MGLVSDSKNDRLQRSEEKGARRLNRQQYWVLKCGQNAIWTIFPGQTFQHGAERGADMVLFLFSIILRKWEVPCFCSCPLKSHFNSWNVPPRKYWKWFNSWLLRKCASSLAVAISLESQFLWHVCPTESKGKRQAEAGTGTFIWIVSQFQVQDPGCSRLSIKTGCLFWGSCVYSPYEHLSVLSKMLFSISPLLSMLRHLQPFSTEVSLFLPATMLSPQPDSNLSLPGTSHGTNRSTSLTWERWAVPLCQPKVFRFSLGTSSVFLHCRNLFQSFAVNCF